MNSNTTTGRTTHHSHHRSPRADSVGGRALATAGRTAVCSTGEIAGTGSVGSCSGGYHRPSP
jgi:hypothetical protein